MSEITLRTLKQHLKQRSQPELVEEIAQLFSQFQVVKDYYALRLAQDTAANEHKTKISTIFAEYG